MELVSNTWGLLDSQRAARLDGAPGRDAADALARGPHPRWRCAACAAAITSPDEGLAVAGHHEHCFSNPHGILYRVGCFGAASGLAPVGEETLAWSWFPGFAWTIMICGACSAHLGWRYRASDDGRVFFGLILDRLVIGPTSGALD